MGRVVVGIYCFGNDSYSVYFLQIRAQVETNEQNGSDRREALQTRVKVSNGGMS